MPYRIPAPPDAEAHDTEDPYAAVLRSQRTRARIVSVVVVVFLAGGIAKVARSHETPRWHVAEEVRLDGARVAIAGARARAASAQSAFEWTMREAIGDDVTPRADLGACPIALPATASIVSGHPAFPLLTVDRAGLGETLPSQAVAGVLADVHRAEGHLAAGRFEEAKLYARALDRPERFGYEVVLLARSTREPRALSGHAYEPGEIEGRAYLYDFGSGRVVCAGDVKAKSSREVGYVYSDRSDTPPSLGPVASMGDAIHEDLRRETERAIIAAVRWRSGPRR